MSPAPETDAKAAPAEEKPIDPRLAPLLAFRVKNSK
jgi:hypothetical protein